MGDLEGDLWLLNPFGHEMNKNPPQGRLGGKEHIWRAMENKKSRFLD